MDALTAAKRISDWSAWIGEIPKPVRDAVAVFDEIAFAEPPQPYFDADGCTPANAAERVEALAMNLAVAARHAEAVNIARQTLAATVLQAAGRSVPEILTRLQAPFDAAVQAYTAAVEVLPAGATAEQLLDAAPEVQAAYATAQDAAREIRKIELWLESTIDLPGYHSFDYHSVLRVVEAVDREQLAALLGAEAATPAEAKLNALYLTAARLGLRFRMATSDIAAAEKKAIDAQPMVKQRKFVSW
jgi:hypothetical protein